MITVEYCDIDLMAILIIGNIHTIIEYYIHEYSYWCFTLWHYSDSVLLCQFIHRMDDYMSRDIPLSSCQDIDNADKISLMYNMYRQINTAWIR